MAEEIIMPKLGMGMEEGTVVEWRKAKDEEVKQGETVVVISSEKIEMEVESPRDGVLLDMVASAGDVVPVGKVIGYVGQPGEQLATKSAGKSAEEVQSARLADAKDEVASTVLTPEKREEKTTSGVTDKTVVSAGRRNTNKNRISPVARKLAREAGIDVEQIEGTGPRGRVTKADVEKAINERAVGQNVIAAESSAPNFGKTPSYGRTETDKDVKAKQGQQESDSFANAKPLTGIRKVIAQRMHSSLQQSAQLTMHMKADVTDLIAVQKKMAEEMEGEQDKTKLTLTVFIARAAILALLKHRQMNSTFKDESMHIHDHVHLGVAVALENGLVVPVIRHAEQCSLMELAEHIQTLSTKARHGELTNEQMKGSTFTITNLGAYGIETFTPILNPPETGILGIGATADEPVYVGDSLQRRSLLPLSLTFDHRIVDGAPAARFLSDVRSYLSKPYYMSMF